MNRIFNLVLIICVVVLALHTTLMIMAEKAERNRWASTDEGRKYLEARNEQQISNAYAFGGEPLNSALVVNFSSNDDPETLEVRDHDIFFDYKADGLAVKTGWAGRKTGFLVFISDEAKKNITGRDLFGNRTLGINPLTDNGFDALSFEDYNGDGLVSADDDTWPGLRIWVDANADAKLDEGELKTPAELGLVSFSLDHKPVDRFLKSHNYLRFRGTANYADGRVANMDEIYFQQMPGSRLNQREKMELPEELKARVPEVAGGGLLQDLREAAFLHPEIWAAIEYYSAAEERMDQTRRLTLLMDAWAATAGLERNAAKRAEGRYNLTANCLAGLTPWQQSILFTLEAWNGNYLYRLPHELYPGQKLNRRLVATGPGEDELALVCPVDVWQGFEMGYVELRMNVYFKFLRFTRLKEYYRQFDADSDAPDFSRLFAWLEPRFAADFNNTLINLLEIRYDLLKEGLPLSASKALDDYLDSKIPAQKPADEELAGLISMVKKNIDLARKADRWQRMLRQWGVDTVEKH
ncbi:hypothetical protein LJB99_04865 [Deltaproteobacteria bacterium OttesenSCG-928-K17]|nr:hypothetical protein [Deltaproteobacteria bacterium OttesenSCG-928-K17]